MIRDWKEFTCDSCMDLVRHSGYRVPDGWAQVTVELSKGSEAIHFCGECWENGKQPKRREDLPILIRRFFGWAIQAKP